MQISKRLQTVSEMVTLNYRVADVGTDHGFVPIYLICSGRSPFVIAMDIRKKPLEKAKENIKEAKVSDKIETRLGNGLEALRPEETDSIIIAGMGGDIMMNILEQGKEIVATVKELILSPHTRWAEVRAYLIHHGYEIDQEKMLIEEGKYYILWHVLPPHLAQKCVYKKEEMQFGKLLIENQDQVLVSYLRKELNKTNELIELMQQQNTAPSLLRKEELSTYAELIRQTLVQMNA